jgi:hypothetical protein
VFTLSGSVEVEGASYGEQTAVWSDFGSDETLHGERGAEALSFAFPPGAFARDSA